MATTPIKRGLGVPHWPAAITLLAIGLGYLLVPDRLRIGPSWLLLAAVIVLLIPLFLARWRGYHDLTHWLGRSATALVTLAVAISAVFLVARLPGSKMSGSELLHEAALIWLINILVFALWYWEIDGGGPRVRRPGYYQSLDFVFPQFQQDTPGAKGWMPGFVDYVFFAFNTSTAFSPTDTTILSQRAKALMMTQSMISLTVLAVLAARAINTL
ncbi:MAG: hypothetical protein ACR2PL_28010 [Dehalococcoidia bacterium]